MKRHANMHNQPARTQHMRQAEDCPAVCTDKISEHEPAQKPVQARGI
jgi:hypothetical protein